MSIVSTEFVSQRVNLVRVVWYGSKSGAALAHGHSDIVTFENRTDQVVAFITELPNDGIPRLRFTLKPRGSYAERVPGKEDNTYEQLRLVDGEDESGTKTSVTITTDTLRGLGGFKLIVTKTGDKFNELGEEDMRKKSWQFSDVFRGLRHKENQLPT